MENTDILYARSYKEVITILNKLPKQELSKIPIEKLEFFNSKMDNKYEYVLDKNKSFVDQEMSPITEAILAILYRDYLANEKEREEIVNKDRYAWNIIEERKREKYNPNNIFKNNNIIEKIEEHKIETDIAIIEEKGFFTKILLKIKSIFNIK